MISVGSVGTTQVPPPPTAVLQCISTHIGMSDDELAIEDNVDELTIEDNDTGADDGAAQQLLSPPRNWPDCFSKPALKQFIAGELKGRRVRLSDPPEPEHVRMGAGMQLASGAALDNALKLRDKYGWDVLGGFVLYEEAQSEGSYTSREHFWNANARGLWLDLTPRRAEHSSLVLVDSALVPVPVPTAEQQARIEKAKKRELAEAERREAERKAAKAAEKAAKREAREREKEAARLAKEALAAQKQKEIDDINQQHNDQLERADPTLRAEKQKREAEERAEEQRKIMEAREAAAKAAAERAERERLEAEKAETEAREKAEAEEKARQAREAAATKVREEKKRAEAAKAAEKAAKEAAAAASKLDAAGGTGLCWDLHILLGLVTPHKEAGSKKFGVGDHAGAYDAYAAAIEVVSAEPFMLAWPAIESLIITCHANAALCCLKLGRNAKALDHCDRALKLPGGQSCGKALLSKLLLRKLTAMVEMADDPLEGADPHELRRALRDAHKRGLATGKAPAAKSFAELAERFDYQRELDDPFMAAAELPADERPQELAEVCRVLSSAFHPERDASSVGEMKEGLEVLLGHEGMLPPSALSETPKGESLLWALVAGYASFEKAVDTEYMTAFFLEALEVLLDFEVPVDTRLPDESGPSARTALMWATLAGCPKAVDALISAGADVNLRDPRGVTPLMYACAPPKKLTSGGGGANAARRLEVAKKLIASGAELDLRDIAGQTALMNSCSWVQPELVRLLLSHGADPTLRHGKGCTAVGVLAPSLSVQGAKGAKGGGDDDDDDLDESPPTADAETLATVATARALIDECIAAVPSEAAKALLKEEVKAAEFFDQFIRALMPIHNRFVATPGARMGDREAALVTEILKRLGMESDYLTQDAPDVSAGGKWSNFFETLQKRLLDRIPPAFLTVFTRDAPPSDDSFALLTSFSTEAIKMAETQAARLQKEQFGGVRTSAYHPETLRQQSLVPWHHRGRVPRCMKDYQNLILLPLRRCISHAVPTGQALRTLSKLGPIIEVGAGSGYWTAMLLERKVDAMAYDLDPPDPSTLTNGFAFRSFATVHKADGASLFQADPQLARERTLLMVWPGQWTEGDAPATVDKDTGERIDPPGWETACLNAYLEAGGQTVVYVGEREEAIEKIVGTAPDTGVSASKAFQRILEHRMRHLETIDVPRLFYTCDDMTVWKRR